ncbi:MAG: leucine-rich repeat protein [Clostridia bacterium]|nr:leucine-rich repeat protein [Clostridia bacterium]
MKRTVLVLAAAVTLLCAVFAFGAFAEETVTVVASSSDEGAVQAGDNITWTLYSDGLLKISGSGAMSIFSKAGDVPWGDKCIAGDQRNNIKKVVIEEGVTSIGGYSFNLCTNLKEVYAASTVEKLDGGYIFHNCNQLDIIELPSGVTCKTTKGAKQNNFSAVKGTFVFYNNSSTSVIIDKTTIDCFANALTVSSKAPDNKIAFRTPSGEVNLGENALEDQTSDVTATISKANDYTFSASVKDASGNALLTDTSVDMTFNSTAGLSADAFEVNDGAIAVSGYDAAVGGVSFNGNLGEYKVIEKIAILTYFPSLNEDINLYFAARVPSYYENAKMTFNFRGSETVVTESVVKNGKTAFKFEDVMPEYMGEEITATLTAELGGKEYASEALGNSIESYCRSVLDPAFGMDEKTMELAAAILLYGEAAQIYNGYKTDYLVTAGLDLDKYRTDAAPENSDLTTVGDAEGAVFVGAGLRCTESMSAYFTFTAEDTEGLTVKISVGGRETAFNVSEITPDKNGKYRVDFDGVMADEFGEIITASFEKNGVEYSLKCFIL